jgi:hypothetical protein
VVFGAGLFSGLPASAQGPDRPPLRLAGIVPNGVRKTATESWGAYDLQVTNLSDNDRTARVLISYTARMNEQYGRDVWVPAHSTLSTWLLVGPAPTTTGISSDIQVLLRDPSQSADQLGFVPGKDLRNSRAVLFRHRDPSTTLVVDDISNQRPNFGRLPQPESRQEEALHAVHVFRQARGLSAHVTIMDSGSLPPTVEAFDGTDLLVLASGRIADDPVGMKTLRHWVEQGGRLWVMLDMVDPRGLVPVLGEAFDFEIVDRVSLTAFQIEGRGYQPVEEQHERPVELVRILLPGHEQAKHTVNGWPAWFSRQVGRGKVFFTTLEARAWFRPRTRRDSPSPFESYPTLGIGLEPLQVLADELHPAPERNVLGVEAFRPMLIEEIGYSVVTRRTLGFIFATVLTATLALAIALPSRRKKPKVALVSRGLPLIGLIGPIAALAAAGVLVAAGESSRRAVAPTVAVAQLVDAVPGAEEAPVHGLLAVYRPDSGAAEAGARQGGLFEMDTTGLEGEMRRFLLTDIDSWHWENLALPAGVRMAPFRFTAPMAGPLAAVARFGPEGVEGKIAAGSFREVGDALIRTPNGRPLAVRLQPDGTFTSSSQDILPAGKYLASGVLSDRQQQREAFYRQLLKRPIIGRADSPSVLLAWAEPIDMHFTLLPDARTIGDALISMPLRLERADARARVTIPGPFISCRRLLDGVSVSPTWELREPADMELRFQLPATALPLTVERARLSVKIDAPFRRVALLAGRGDAQMELHDIDSPLDPIRVDIRNERLLQLDPEGGLYVTLKIGESVEGDKPIDKSTRQDKWTIEYLELEVSGRMGSGGGD